MKKVFISAIAVILVILLAVPAMALEGVWHNPYSMDDLYEVQPTERYPRDPAAGETVHIKGTTWPVHRRVPLGRTVQAQHNDGGVFSHYAVPSCRSAIVQARKQDSGHWS